MNVEGKHMYECRVRLPRILCAVFMCFVSCFAIKRSLKDSVKVFLLTAMVDKIIFSFLSFL